MLAAGICGKPHQKAPHVLLAICQKLAKNAGNFYLRGGSGSAVWTPSFDLFALQVVIVFVELRKRPVG